MRMMLKFVSVLFLLASVLVGVIDSIQSVSGGRVMLTPVATTIATLGGQGLQFVQALEKATGGPFDSIMHMMLRQPACGVFLLVALLSWMLAYRRPKRNGGVSAA